MSDLTESEQAGEKIVVTPKMMEAGAEVMGRFDPEADSYEEFALMIFCAMWAVRGQFPQPVDQLEELNNQFRTQSGAICAPQSECLEALPFCSRFR